MAGPAILLAFLARLSLRRARLTIPRRHERRNRAIPFVFCLALAVALERRARWRGLTKLPTPVKQRHGHLVAYVQDPLG